MARKTSQAAKKDSATESKSEGPTPRRSGRAVAKAEPIEQSQSRKEASRSRRSSTAAQTAASVADSKTPKGRTQIESTPPSEGRSRSNRESGESPATRVKSARRSASHINYKESDGEEETATPKYDENFDSAEELEGSESDENSKPKGRNRSVKTAAKSNEVKEIPRSSGRRKGRTTKKKSDEESEVAEVSDSGENVETENSPGNKKVGKTPAKAKEPQKSARGRRAKVEPDAKIKPVVEEKAKPSRRSARASSSKEETPKKRPSRSVQAKKYTEEDEEEEIEEIDDSKVDASKSDTAVPGKRKRSTSVEPNKRLKKDVSESEAEIKETDDVENVKEEKEIKDGSESEKEKDESEVKKETNEEPMEVDEVQSNEVDASEVSEKPVTPVEELKDSKTETNVTEEKMDNQEDKENDTSLKEKVATSVEQENDDSAEHVDENLRNSDSEQESRADQSLSSGLEDSQEAKEDKTNEPSSESKTVEETSSTHEKVELASEPSKNSQQTDENSKEPKTAATEKCSKEETDKGSKESVSKTENALENSKKESIHATNENSVSDEKKATTNETAIISSPNSVHSKQSEPSLNGPEKSSLVPNSAPIIHSNLNTNFESAENPSSKANGEHDNMHTNAISPKKDQYFPLPGRKYILNPKMNEALRQSIKDKTFTCASFNLSTSSSEVCLQKDKLLNELKYLDANIICIQQISKTFYNGALEPNLRGLGFNGVFCQPEESLKGLATFYKTSLFKLNKHCETSLKHLIEKELEASPLEPNDRAAVRAHMKRCGSVLLTNITTIPGTHAITVANVQVPATDLSLQTLQVSCLGRELFRINGGTNRPLLIAGELNIKESEAAYQLLRDGYLSNEMIEELMRRKDVVIPGKENASLINLLWKSFQHPSSNLSSCYQTVLEHEIFIPEKKVTSPDLLWYSSDCMYTVGVLDFTSDKLK
ncbi:neurofilament heavy polypeptide-like [Uloborus diversus]|uniref:neurofilament heavy polypeptide-like n=1 Tax=Uloborus diversus TaxID=327109 RepID=UPI0024099C85|nr:neurofilament heavy polypeptide-like [Uloborus diversus]XP_054714136.1 neurofilament heavy polypeptide-like [Uloborus diversus]